MLSAENDKYIYDKTKGNELWLVCFDCNRKTYQTTIFSLQVTGERDGWYHFTDVYEVTQCNGCRAITFRKASTNSEDFYVDDNDKFRYTEREELFPPRLVGRRHLEDTHFLPYAVQSIYNETYMALCNKLPILAGVGIRALIEAVCHDKSTQGSDLRKKIDSLVDLGALTAEGAEILHGLRILGNTAAHEVKPHNEQVLATAFDVVEHLLQGVYILPAKTQGLRKTLKPPIRSVLDNLQDNT